MKSSQDWQLEVLLCLSLIKNKIWDRSKNKKSSMYSSLLRHSSDKIQILLKQIKKKTKR